MISISPKDEKKKKAYESGSDLESKIAAALEQFLGFRKVDSRVCKGAFWQDSEFVYAQKCYFGKTIYGTRRKVDFVLWNPITKKETIIECKRQNTAGTVDEKLPYLVNNIRVSGVPTIVVIEGNGYKQGARNWLRDCAGKDNLELVLEFVEFESMAMGEEVVAVGKKHWLFNR